ncbi:hypothetical protein HDV00_012114 [Rhizophlyctis rosea]|nr:hypothetical protein HDV00_012114 [Rhizophlyctis rosea]
MSASNFRLPVLLGLGAVAQVQPRQLSYDILLCRNSSHKSELVWLRQSLAPILFNPRSWVRICEGGFDSVHFVNESLPSKLVVLALLYPKPINDNGLRPIPAIHSASPRVNLNAVGAAIEAAIATPIKPSLFNAFDALDEGDVTIHLKNGTLKAHSFALRYGVPESYFSVLMSQPMEEQREKTINLNDIDCTLFKEILRYVYTGHVNITGDCFELIELYRAADRFQLTELARWTQIALQTALTPPRDGQETCRILKQIIAYPELETCQIQCLRTIIAAGNTLGNTAEWEDLVNTQGFAEVMRDTMMKSCGSGTCT